jgi:hypothetical protein
MQFILGRKLRDQEKYTEMYPKGAVGAELPALPPIVGVDRGEAPIWKGTTFKFPESNNMRLIAPGPIRCGCLPPTLGGCCGIGG